jgi:hypothetical protein
VIEKVQGDLATEGLLVIQAGVETTDRVGPARLHRTRAIQDEDDRTVHLQLWFFTQILKLGARMT